MYLVRLKESAISSGQENCSSCGQTTNTTTRVCSICTLFLKWNALPACHFPAITYDVSIKIEILHNRHEDFTNEFCPHPNRIYK